LNILEKTSHLNSIRAFGRQLLTICPHQMLGKIEFRNSLFSGGKA